MKEFNIESNKHGHPESEGGSKCWGYAVLSGNGQSDGQVSPNLAEIM